MQLIVFITDYMGVRLNSDIDNRYHLQLSNQLGHFSHVLQPKRVQFR